MAYTYDELVGDLVAWVEDDNEEFLAALDRIIAIGSMKAARDLDLEILDMQRSGLLSTHDPLALKPRDTQVMRSLHINMGQGQFRHVEQRTYDYVADYNASAKPGVPRYYAELDGDQFIVAPVPNVDYDYEARIRIKALALGPGRQRTWVSENAPEAVLYACLMGCEEYLKDDERIAVWRGRYNNEVIPSYREQFKHLMRHDYSPQMPVTGDS